MTIQKKVLVFLILSCFLFATVFSVSGCGGLASLVTTAASTSLGGMEAWVFVPAAGAKNASHTSKVTPPAGFIALPGATLTIVGTGYSAVTDSSGYASITGLANGTYTVTVAKEGYKTFTYTVTVATGVDTQVGGSSGVQTETSTAPGIMNLSATSGAIGDSVTITGVNFGSTQDVVQFNGVDVTEVTSWSSTSIVCKVPSGATTGDVVVKVGSEASNTVSFTVSGGGLSWHTMDSSTSKTLNSVYGTSDGATVFAVGGKLKILKYTTASGVWTSKYSDPYQPSDFTGVWCTSSGGDAFAVGGGGNAYHSTDGGETWASSDPGVGTALNKVWGSSASNVFAVGAGGVIRHYEGHTPWHFSDSRVVNDLNGIWGSSSSNIFAVGNTGVILYSTDNGVSWATVVPAPVDDRIILGVWCTSDGGKVFIVYQNDGRILCSTDKFTTWTQWTSVETGVSDQLNGIWGSSSNDVFVVCNNYQILHFDGTHWSKMTLPTDETNPNLLGVWGSSSSNVYAVGADGKILRYGTE